MKALKSAGTGIATIELPRHAWRGASGKGESTCIAVRGIKPIGKHGKELGIPATISEKKEVPALAGKDKNWIPASTDSRAKIEKDMEETLDGLSKNAAKINATAPMRDTIGAALAGNGHSC